MSVQHIRDVGVALPAHIKADDTLECAANLSAIFDKKGGRLQQQHPLLTSEQTVSDLVCHLQTL
jgi:hypothetical protein